MLCETAPRIWSGGTGVSSQELLSVPDGLALLEIFSASPGGGDSRQPSG